MKVCVDLAGCYFVVLLHVAFDRAVRNFPAGEAGNFVVPGEVLYFFAHYFGQAARFALPAEQRGVVLHEAGFAVVPAELMKVAALLLALLYADLQQG
jgi:hypothetical protein